MVIGSPGGGKSHFSAELSYRTGLPLFHLDRGSWSGDAARWQPGEAQRFVEWQTRTVEDDEWIFDGNYGGTMNLRLARADTVFFFDLSRFSCLLGYFRRLLLYPLRPAAAREGEPRERFDPKFIKYIWTFRRINLAEQLQKYPDLRIFVFRRRKDIKTFFEHLELSIAREREARLEV